MTESTAQKTNYVLQPHLVAYLDVLGQREKIKQLKIPKTPDEYRVVAEAMRGTVGIVLELRSAFLKQFEVFEAGATNSAPGSSTLFRPRFLGHSDSFITFVALNNDQLLNSIMTSFSVLSGASCVVLTAMASGHALRGGIDVGPGVEIAPDEIYGPALAQAYTLESRDADYPRVLIGDGFEDQLLISIAESQKLPALKAENLAEIVRRMRVFITTDKDGRQILDFLGPVLANVSKQSDSNILVQRAYQFVLDEQERWLAMGNTKECGRYTVLRRYFEERLHLWGLVHEKRRRIVFWLRWDHSFRFIQLVQRQTRTRGPRNLVSAKTLFVKTATVHQLCTNPTFSCCWG